MAKKLTLTIVARDLASKKITKIGKTVKIMGGIVGFTSAVIIGRKMVQAFTNMIRVGIEFENQMVRVGAVLGNVAARGTANFQKLQDAAIELGARTVYTARQVAEAQLNFARAGFKVDEILGALEPTLSLAAAGNLSIAEAATTAATAYRVFAQTLDKTMTAEQRTAAVTKKLTRAVDIITRTATISNQTVGDFSAAMQYAAPVAKVAGASIFDLGVAFGILANRGLRATIAGTGIRKAFSTILKSAGEATQGIEGFNKELTSTIDEGVGLDKNVAEKMFKIGEDGARIFLGWANAVEVMKSAGYNAADMFTIFGVRAGNSMAILTDLGGPAINEFSKTLSKFEGVAERVRERSIDSLGGDLIILKSAWESLSIVVTQTGTPAMRGYVQALTEIIHQARTSSDAMEKLNKGFKGVIAIIMFVTQLLVFLTRSIYGIGTSFAIAASTVRLAMVSLVRVVAENVTLAAVELLKLQDAVRDTLDDIKDEIDKFTPGPFKFGKAVFDKFTPKPIKWAVNFVIPDNPFGVLSDVALGDGMEKFLTSVGMLGSKLKPAMDTAGESIQAELDAAVQQYRDYKDATDELLALIEELRRSGEERATTFQLKSDIDLSDLVSDQEEMEKIAASLNVDVAALGRAYKDFDEILSSNGVLVAGDRLLALGVKISNVLAIAEKTSPKKLTLALNAMKGDVDAIVLGLQRSGMITQQWLDLQARIEAAEISLQFGDTDSARLQMEHVNKLYEELGVKATVSTEMQIKKIAKLERAWDLANKKMQGGVVSPLQTEIDKGDIAAQIQAIVDDVGPGVIEVRADIVTEGDIDDSMLRGLLKSLQLDTGIQFDIQGLKKSEKEVENIAVAFKTLMQGIKESGVSEIEITANLDKLKEMLGGLMDTLDPEQYAMLVDILPNFDPSIWNERLAKVREMEFNANASVLEGKMQQTKIAGQELLGYEIEAKIASIQAITDLEHEQLANRYEEDLAQAYARGEDTSAITAEYVAKDNQITADGEAAVDDVKKRGVDLDKQYKAQMLTQGGQLMTTMFGDSKLAAYAAAVMNSYGSYVKAMELYGPVKGAILGSIGLATGLAQAAKIKKVKGPRGAAFGTVVGGTDTGRDTEPYMLRPGERVLSVPDAKILDRVLADTAQSSEAARLGRALSTNRQPVMRTGGTGFAFGGAPAGTGRLIPSNAASDSLYGVRTENSPDRPGSRSINDDERPTGDIHLHIDRVLDGADLRSVLEANLDEFGEMIREAGNRGTI